MITLVLLPGMDGTGRLFADFIHALGPEFETIVVVYPADSSLGYSELEAIARSFLPRDRPFILLAESFSGPIGISISASNPPGLRGLVLCCSFARNPRPILGLFWPLFRLFPSKFLPTIIISKCLLGRSSTTHTQSQLGEALALVSPDTLRMRIVEAAKVNVSQELGQIRVPVLYLRATRDCVVTRAAWEDVLGNVPHAESAEVNGPHLLLQAAPLATAAIVSEFSRKAIANGALARESRGSHT